MRRAVWNWGYKDVMKVIDRARDDERDIARDDERDIAVLDLYNNTDGNVNKVVQWVTALGLDLTRDADSVIVYL